MRRFLFTFIKVIIGGLAAANLIALFVYEYQFPDDWLGYAAKLPVIQKFVETEQPIMTVEAVTESAWEPGSEEEVIAEPTGQMHIEVPSSPINYNGSGELDLMTGVYVVNADGTAASDVVVTTDITEGSSRREKTVVYSITTENGDVITQTRNLYLGSRYTGPNITVVSALPYCLEGEAESYAAKAIEAESILAEDGFKKDITDSVTSTLKSYNTGSEEATITLKVTNRFKDTFSTDISVTMSATGVVMKLTTDHVTLEAGTEFKVRNYIKECHDAQGNSLLDRIAYNGSVDVYTPGDYTIQVYCSDEAGVYSKFQTLVVSIVVPEPSSDAGQGQE